MGGVRGTLQHRPHGVSADRCQLLECLAEEKKVAGVAQVTESLPQVYILDEITTDLGSFYLRCRVLQLGLP